MNETAEASAIATHLKASKALLAACLERLRATDAEAFQGAAVAMKAGAGVRITTAMSVAGLREVSVDLVDVQGNVANVARAAFDEPTKN